MNLPGAIIFVNSDLNATLQQTLEVQLRTSETLMGNEFDDRLISDPNYPDIIHGFHLRILVIRDDFRTLPNFDKADLVLFLAHGNANIEKNNFGPPRLSVPVNRLNIYDLLRYNLSDEVTILPNDFNNVPYVYGSRLGGIFAIETRDNSGVEIPNPDNMYNNPDFLKRK